MRDRLVSYLMSGYEATPYPGFPYEINVCEFAESLGTCDKIILWTSRPVKQGACSMPADSESSAIALAIRKLRRKRRGRSKVVLTPKGE